MRVKPRFVCDTMRLCSAKQISNQKKNKGPGIFQQCTNLFDGSNQSLDKSVFGRHTTHNENQSRGIQNKRNDAKGGVLFLIIAGEAGAGRTGRGVDAENVIHHQAADAGEEQHGEGPAGSW